MPTSSKESDGGGKFDIAAAFEVHYAEQDRSSAIATLKTLIDFLSADASGSVTELSKNIRSAINTLKELDCRTEVESVAEIYFRFITLRAEKFVHEITALKADMLRRSHLYMEKVLNSRKELAKNAQKFITDGSRVLVHSMSRAVLETLKQAAATNRKHFTVYVTESAPDYLGRQMVQCLKEVPGITEVTLILDSAVGYILERVDLVLVGAEGVCESGGIINKIGTYQLAICAKAHNKPFYVLAESYKFIRLFPLNQADIPKKLKWRDGNNGSKVESSGQSAHNTAAHPLVDYTPPNYITLLLTDLGTRTTAAVCDTLLELYT